MVRDVLYHGRRTSDKKMILNKRTLILASSLAAIPLATLLVASAIRRRRRRKSPQTHQFLRATKSTTAVNANSVLDRQQLKGKAQGQQSTSWQESEIKAVMRATDGTITSKSTTTTAATTTTVPSAIPSIIVPSSTSDSGVIVSHQTPKEEERSLSEEARKAGGSLKELIVTAVKEAKDSAKQTGKRVSEQTINITATVDSKDIRSLGDNVNALVDIFEKTMTEIRKESYDDQIKLLDSYKELLHRHLKVIHARSRMASKLKPGA
jgi:cytoskeletal protein RodZ